MGVEIMEKELRLIKEELIEAQQQVSVHDRKRDAIYHDIETRNFNAYEGYALAKELQEVLQLRRVWKVKEGELRSEYMMLGGDKALTRMEKARKKKVKKFVERKGWYSHFSEEAMSILNGGIQHA